MRFSLALDGREERDRMVEAGGVPFLFDPFAALVVRDHVRILYNPDTDGFAVSVPGTGAQC